MAGTPVKIEAGEDMPPLRLISISARADEVCANQEKALHWLSSPNPSLAGLTPLEVAGTDKGYQEVKDILTRIEHGVLRLAEHPVGRTTAVTGNRHRICTRFTQFATGYSQS
jgi:hypothetical protein